jgi:hypothetical protein
MILNYLAAVLSIHWLHKRNAAITKILQPKQAAATHLELEVATSAIEIDNAIVSYYCTISSFHIHSFVRESWLGHVLCIDWTHTSLETHCKMQNNYFLPGFL